MSYRNPSQELSKPIFDILDGIEKFDRAVIERIRSHEWTEEHIQRIDDLRQRLIALQRELIQLEDSTW